MVCKNCKEEEDMAGKYKASLSLKPLSPNSSGTGWELKSHRISVRTAETASAKVPKQGDLIC